MRRTRKLKKAVGVAAVVAMTATMMPFGVMADSLGTIPVLHMLKNRPESLSPRCLQLSGIM